MEEVEAQSDGPGERGPRGEEGPVGRTERKVPVCDKGEKRARGDKGEEDERGQRGPTGPTGYGGLQSPLHELTNTFAPNKVSNFNYPNSNLKRIRIVVILTNQMVQDFYIPFSGTYFPSVL